MPTIQIYPRSTTARDVQSGLANSSGLPQILQTPSGLALLEIQGTINTSSESRDSSQPIGKLVFPAYDVTRGVDDTSWHKRVHLYVGKHQRLTGEVKKLAKPVAVLRRGGDQDEDDALEIAEIVKWKLLFAHRPEPVGGEAAAGE